MNVFFDLDSFEKSKKTAVVVGKFDGFHKGHRLLVDAIVSEKEHGLSPVVVTIEKSFDAPGILSVGERRNFLEAAGVDSWVRLTFDDIAGLSAKDFFFDVLIGKFSASFIACGDDFRFGKGRAGDALTLAALSDLSGVTFRKIDRLSDEKGPIESTRIRSNLSNGLIEEANALLMDPYSIRGTVVHGMHLGTKFGVPTANVIPGPDKFLPRFGVYFGMYSDGTLTLPAVVNVGVDPTIADGLTPLAEIHLPGADHDLYGKHVSISLLTFVRPEEKFESTEALQEAIRKDVASFEAWAAHRTCEKTEKTT